MHQTISGVTHKSTIYNRNSIDTFLKESRKKLQYLKSNCLYQNKKIISDKVLNYLNIETCSDVNYQLKALMRKEYDNCERMYPYLGDIFILSFFNLIDIFKNKNEFRYSKKYQNILIDTICDVNVKEIAKWFFDECSLEYEIFVDKHYGKDIIIEKSNSINMKINFDNDFIGNTNVYNVNKYRYAIIDGFLESVGEIHHLLHFANKTKEAYVIFCFGMSDQVKNTIIKNNADGKTEIIPISISFDENSVNILNDIALIHKSDVISSLKGQTISQELRKPLPVGENIKIYKKGNIVIKPIASDIDLMRHKNYLRNKIETSEKDINTDVLEKRIKNLSTNSIKLFTPSDLLSDIRYSRDLDYFLRYLTNLNTNSVLIEDENYLNSNYIIPSFYIDYLKEKINSLKETYNNIDKIIIKGGGDVT